MADQKPRRRFFSACFRSSTRSPSPPPPPADDDDDDDDDAEPAAESPGAEDEEPAPDSEAEPEPEPEAEAEAEPEPEPDRPAGLASRSPDTRVASSAYDEAWALLGEAERASLCDEASIRALFEKLDGADQQHQAKSWLKRGKMAAGLQYVSDICGYLGLVTAWIPVPGLDAALSLFKGTVAIVVGICGVYDGLTSYVREFLNRIPVIERCNTVLWSHSASLDIHNEESRIRRLLETFHSEIPDMVIDFNDHADRLSNMMEVETLVTVKKILDQQTEDFVDDNLYKRDHIGHCDMNEGNRSDEACHWITSEEAFEDWAYGAHGVLTMYGVVGCGKTATASYVAKYLRDEAKAPVLAYYCTQQEQQALSYIVCSLTYQLLQTQTELKEKFKEWSEKRQATTLDKPSNKPAVLAEFLSSCLQNSKEQVFIVLDGLDECEEDARSDLLALFRDLISTGAPVKVFVSSRQRDDILETLTSSKAAEQETEPVMPIPLFHIDMIPSEERDRILARHLAARPLRQISDDNVREIAIEQLASRAEGSAIWLKMAMASLDGAKNERRIEKCLDFLETSPKLVDWYKRLFKDAEAGTCNDREILERALETLAVARRPLTIDELARASYIDDAENGESLEALNEAAAEIDFLSLVRPFVATLSGSADGKGMRVRLVHQSLLELLLTARPSDWDMMAATKERRRTAEHDQRRRELNEQLTRRCVKYLLLDDLEVRAPDEDEGTVADAVPEGYQGDDEPWTGSSFDQMFMEPAAKKRAQLRAQTWHLHFYDYAASHWADHFAACEDDAADDLKETARTLLDVDASGCTDWVSFVRAEHEAAGEIFPSSQPATLAAYFGLTETLAGILADPESDVDQSTKDEALFWASRGGRAHIATHLLEYGADANQHVADEHTALTIAADLGHLACVQALLADPRTDADMYGSRQRTALSLAAGSGHEQICASLVAQGCNADEPDGKGMTPLFYAAAATHLSVLRALAALPDVDVNHRDNAGRTALCHAAEAGSLASLQQLLATEGIDADLADNEGRSPLIWAAIRGRAACVDALMRHVPPIDATAVDFADRKNAMHFACEGGMHAVVLSLLEHDYAAIDEADVDGWTPLMWAIQSGPECVASLLATGRVDIECRDNQGRTPLCLAVQWAPSVEVVRVLLHYGADAETTDSEGQTPLTIAMKEGAPKGFAMADEIAVWIGKKRSMEDEALLPLMPIDSPGAKASPALRP